MLDPLLELAQLGLQLAQLLLVLLEFELWLPIDLLFFCHVYHLHCYGSVCSKAPTSQILQSNYGDVSCKVPLLLKGKYIIALGKEGEEIRERNF